VQLTAIVADRFPPTTRSFEVVPRTVDQQPVEGVGPLSGGKRLPANDNDASVEGDLDMSYRQTGG